MTIFFKGFVYNILCSSLTYVYSGISIHDSLESVEVKLWSTVVLHLSYGLPKPV